MILKKKIIYLFFLCLKNYSWFWKINTIKFVISARAFSNSSSTSLYSCITQLVLNPPRARSLWKTKVFLSPAVLELWWIGLSFPVAFQYPSFVALFIFAPLPYFLSNALKKYHSWSLVFNPDLSNHPIHLKKIKKLIN